MNFRAFLAFLILVLVVSTGFGQTFSTSIGVSKDAGAHSPAMHVGRDGTVFVSWFENYADIYFSHSTNGGATFSSPVRVSRQVTTNSYTSLLQRAPNFAVDTKGVIHLVWMEARVPNPKTGHEQSDIWYVRSTDDGETWTQPASIMDTDDSSLYAQDYPSIAIDSSNRIYVCYLDNRYLMRGIVPHYKMHLERSTDGGQTWTKPVIADNLPFTDAGTCECCRDDIAVSREGHVYIAFRTNMTEPKGDMRDIFIARSMDGGVTFDSSIQCQLGDWNLDACPTKGPQIALDTNESLHVAWSDARDDSGKLVSYYSLLRKGDSSVFPNYSVSYGTPNATWPTLAIAPNGLIAYAYTLDFSGGPNRFTYSSDGGNSWHRTLGFPGSFGDAETIPALAFDGSGNLYAAWQDETANGILFTKISNLNVPQLPGVVTSHVKPVYPPNTAVRLSWSVPNGMRMAPFVWYSFRMGMGAVNWGFGTRDTFYQFDSLPAGDYSYTIMAQTAIGSGEISGSFTVAPPALVTAVAPAGNEVFPNPVTNGVLQINAADLSSSTPIIIFDERGSMVKRCEVSTGNGILNLHVRDLPAGSYVCVLIGKSPRRIRFIVP